MAPERQLPNKHPDLLGWQKFHKDHNTLLQSYKSVRNTFFPRWDKAEKWKVVIKSDLPGIARCVLTNKTIIIRKVPGDRDELDRLLIHEICHSSCHLHASKWFKRMLNAAEIAEAVGRKALSELLLKDIENYKHRTKLTANLAYRMIKERISEAFGSTYQEVIDFVSSAIGRYPNEFEARYKRSRAVYDSYFRRIKKRGYAVRSSTHYI